MIDQKLSLNYVTWRDDPFVEVAKANRWNVEHRPFHQLLVESLGAPRPAPLKGVAVSKIFDGKFRNQTLLSYSVVGTQDGNLGAVIPTGSAARFDHSGEYESLFDNNLQDYLLLEGFRGWITFTGGAGGITGISHGLPFLTNWNWLESMDRPLREWMRCPSRLLESWSVALLVSKFPYPLRTIAPEPFEVTVGVETRRHFSLLGEGGGAELGPVSSRSLAIGVAVGWARTLGEAARRAQGVARRVGVEGKQFRSDAVQQVSDQIVLGYQQASSDVSCV